MQKIFAFLGVLIIFTATIFSTAFAKSNAELAGIEAFDVDKKNLRIEISFKKDMSPEKDISTKVLLNELIVDLQNTNPGRVNRHAGFNNKAIDSVKKFSFKQDNKKIRLQFEMKIPIADGSYKINFVRAEKKQPAKIVIDIQKNSTVENEFDVNDKVVVIDAGHGGSDTGARGSHGVLEKDVTLSVAKKTERLLTESGAKVVMTRTTDRDVASPTASNGAELQARVNKTPPQADLFISIHCNAFSNPYSHGMETYYHKGSYEGYRLAKFLNEELERYGGRYNRGVKTANFYVLRHARVPACLVELAFVTNYTEENLLADDDYQEQLAQAITSAVNRYFNDY